ncbi:MAG: helix-turn-helix domain-containing protein [Defluviitaleaceae bacterium]|nr:helix-turn-helix domain-containing protein [Defluviitaleaceae bacterium]
MNRVKELREEKGLKQIDLAGHLNISQATLSNWERSIHDPDNESLGNLARIFDCTIDYLLCNSDIRYPVRLGDGEEAKLEQVFYRIVHEAKNSGLDPHDLEMAIDFIKRAKDRKDIPEK